MAVGQVKFTIYFGTNFDDFNVPYFNDLIRKSATKTMELTGQYVWQNTYLSEIRVNVTDYQDIVGAQYVEVSDEGTASRGSHWYAVRAYQQLSRKTCDLIIEYDPLLSIQISNISGIHGTMTRWTVDSANDTHFRWIYTTEPIDQAEKFTYNYFRHSCVDESKALFPVVGFPYNMSKAPVVEPYKNQDATNTNIYYPKMEANTLVTKFHSTAHESIDFNDGMTYYLWRPKESDVVYMSYNKAIGLGFDLVSNAYMLPASTMYTMQLGDDGALESITGKVVSIESGMSLYDSAYENNKANDIGIFFTLYNEVSGESVTIANYDLNSTQLELTCDPYSNGRFYARFKGYFGDTNGYSGQVMSAPFKSYSINSATPFNIETAVRQIGNQMSSTVNIYDAQTNVAETYRRWSVADASLESMNGVMQNAASVAAFLAMPMGGNGLMTMGTSNILAAGDAKIVNNAMMGANNISNALGKGIYDITKINNTAAANIALINAQKDAQISKLSQTGTLGKVQPPVFKLNNAIGVSGSGYTFIVKRSDLGTNDKTRADKFFRWYGYNVDQLPLNSVNQLYARDNFTFIQANNVLITDTKTATDMTRLRDSGTTKYIQDRFATGLRIWQKNPDFDMSKPNPKR